MEEAMRRAEANWEEKEEKQAEQRIWSWGAGTDGQLGTGRLEDDYLPQLLHLPSLCAAGPLSLLACGGAHVIALTSAGKVLTWGRGSPGQLGHGEIINYSLIPKPVTSLDSYFITHVAAGWSHSGFVSDSGCVFTCGDGSFGQLGHGDYRSQCSPVKVLYFEDKHVWRIACGMRHTLVLLKENQVYGFGSGKRGQLGISKDKVKSVSLPELTDGLQNVDITEIAANGDHSAALSVDGHLYTWGRGFNGCPDAPLPLHSCSSLCFSKASLGWNHALGLTDNGEVFMLGGNHHGALASREKHTPGMQVEISRETTLEKVLDSMKIVDIATGAEHSALVTENGEIKTWGWGEHGQLGLGDTGDRIYPSTVSIGNNLDATVKVYCGSGFTFAVIVPLISSLT